VLLGDSFLRRVISFRKAKSLSFELIAVDDKKKSAAVPGAFLDPFSSLLPPFFSLS
jgi:hypothetical protein